MVNTNFHIDVQVTNINQLTALSNAMLNLNASTANVLKRVKGFDPVSKGLNEALGRSNKGVDNHAKTLSQLVTNQSALSNESKRVKADIQSYSSTLLSGTKSARENVPVLKEYSKNLNSIRARALTEDLKSMAVEMKRLGKDAQFTGRSMIIGITTPILAFAKTGLFAFEKLDAEMVRLNKLVDNVASSVENAYNKMGVESSKATETQKANAQAMVNEFNKLDDSLLNVSRTFGVARELVVSIAGDFAELGLNSNQSMVALTQLAAEAEKLGNLDIGPAKDLVQSMYAQASTIIQENTLARGKLVNAIKVEEEAVTVASSQLAMFNSIENTTALSLRDLAQAFPEVSASATAFGLSMTEAASLLAPMKAAGFDVSASANSIKVSLQRLNDPTVKSTKMMAMLSQTTGYDFAQATHLGLTSIDALAKGYDTLTKSTNYGKEGALEFFSQLFGVRQGPRMEKAIQDLSLFNNMIKQTGSVESDLTGKANAVLDVHNTLLPTIKTFSDIGVVARASAAEIGDQITYLDQFGKQQVLTVSYREIAAAKAARKAVGDYILDQEKQGNNLLSQITSQAGRGLIVELGGVAAASERSKSELNTALGSVRVTMDKIKTDFKFFAAEFVKNFKPTLESIGRFVSKLVTKFQEMSPASKKMIAAFAAIAAAAGPLVFAFGQAKLFLSTLGLAVLRFVPGLSHLTLEAVASTQSLLYLRKPLIMVGDTIETSASRFGLLIARMSNIEGPIGRIAKKFGILTGQLRATRTASDDVVNAIGQYRPLPKGTTVNQLRSLTPPPPPTIISPPTPSPSPVVPGGGGSSGAVAIQNASNTAAATTTTAATTAAGTTTTAATTAAGTTTAAATTSAGTTTSASTTNATTTTTAASSAATTTTGAATSAAATTTGAATSAAAQTTGAATTAATETVAAATTAAAEISGAGAASTTKSLISRLAKHVPGGEARAAAREARDAAIRASQTIEAQFAAAMEQAGAGFMAALEESLTVLNASVASTESTFAASAAEINAGFSSVISEAGLGFVAALEQASIGIEASIVGLGGAGAELSGAAAALTGAALAFNSGLGNLGQMLAAGLGAGAPTAAMAAPLALNAGMAAPLALEAAGMTGFANEWGFARGASGMNQKIIETTLANPTIMGELPAPGQTVAASKHLPIRGLKGRMTPMYTTTLAGPVGGYFPATGNVAANIAADVEKAMLPPQLALPASGQTVQALKHPAIPAYQAFPEREFANAFEANRLTPRVTQAIPMGPVPIPHVAQDLERTVSSAIPMGPGPFAMPETRTLVPTRSAVEYGPPTPNPYKNMSRAQKKEAKKLAARTTGAAESAATQAAVTGEKAIADATMVASAAPAEAVIAAQKSSQAAEAEAVREMRKARKEASNIIKNETIAAKNAAEAEAAMAKTNIKRGLFRRRKGGFRPSRGSYTSQLINAAESDLPGAPVQGAASFAENAVAYETRKAGRAPRRMLRSIFRKGPVSNVVPLSARGAIEQALPFEEEVTQGFLQNKYTGTRLTDKIFRLPGAARREARRAAKAVSSGLGAAGSAVSSGLGAAGRAVSEGVGSVATKGVELGTSALNAGVAGATSAIGTLTKTAEEGLAKSSRAFTKFGQVSSLHLMNVKNGIKNLSSKGISKIATTGSNLLTSVSNSGVGRLTKSVGQKTLAIAKSPWTVAKAGWMGAKQGMQPSMPGAVLSPFAKGRGAIGGFATGIMDVIKKVVSLKKIFLGLGITAIIFAIIAGIKILVDLFKSGGNSMKSVGKTFSQAWNMIKDAVMAVVAPIKDTIATLVSMVGGKQKKGLAGGFSTAADAIKKVAEAISNFIKKYIVPIVTFVMVQVVAIIKSIVKFIQGFIEMIKGHWGKGFKLLGEAAAGLARVVIKVITGLLKGWIWLWKTAVKGLISVTTGLASVIIKVIGAAIEKIAGFVADLLENIPFIGEDLAKPIRSAGKAISDGADWLGKQATNLGNNLGKGIEAIAGGINDGIDAAGGFVTGKIDEAIGKQDELVKGGNKGKRKRLVYELGKKDGEAYADGMGQGLEDNQNKIDDAIKTALEGMQQKFVDLVTGKMGDALGKATEGLTDALQKQKDAALKVYDDQLSNLDKMQKAEESLTKEMQYQSDRRKMIKERELQIENYQRNRALAIYEGRIDDARMLSLEEVKNSEDYNTNLKNLDDARAKDLAAENLQALKDAITKAQEEASKFFDDQIKNFQDAANEITKFPPQTIEEYRAQLDKLNKLASDAAKNNGDSFSGMLEGMVSNINETIPNKGVPAFSNALDQLTQVAHDKYGMSDNGIAGMTVAMLENIGATIGSNTLINENFNTIVDNLKNSAAGAFDELSNTIVTPTLDAISGIITEKDPFKVLSDAVAFANETIMREMTGMVTGVASKVGWLLPYISAAVNQLTMLNAAAAAAANMPAPAPIGPPTINNNPLFGTADTMETWLSHTFLGQGGNPTPKTNNTPVPHQAAPMNTVQGTFPQGAPSAPIPAATPRTPTAPPATSKPVTTPKAPSVAPNMTPRPGVSSKPVPSGFKPVVIPANPKAPKPTPVKGSNAPRMVPSNSKSGGFANGGYVKPQAFANGGSVRKKIFDTGFKVPGFDSTAVPTILHGGEFVINSKAVQNIGLATLQNMNNMRFNKPDSATKPGVINSSTSTVNIYVDNFIGEDEWFNQMIKKYNMNVLPRNQKGAGLENRTIHSYNGLSRGM